MAVIGLNDSAEVTRVCVCRC